MLLEADAGERIACTIRSGNLTLLQGEIHSSSYRVKILLCSNHRVWGKAYYQQVTTHGRF